MTDKQDDASAPPPAPVTLPTDEDLKTLVAGQSFTLPIVNIQGIPRIFADSMGVSLTMSGFLDVTCLSMRTNLVSQTFVVNAASDSHAQVAPRELLGGPLLVEEAVVRMQPKVALGLAAALLNHLRTAKLVSEEQIAETIKGPEVG